MEYTRQLIDFFPDRVRDRIDANEDTAIEHFASAIQPGLDLAIDIIDREADIYDPDICPPELLDWLGQLVGLARAGTDYLGLGLNPAWSNPRKRQAINRAWQYWQLKGTRLGVAEAIKIWLDWQPAGTNQLQIIKPFGDRPGHTPPQWSGWNYGYYQELIQPYRHIKRLGGGDLPQGIHPSNYRYLNPIGRQFELNGFKSIPIVPGSPTLVADINAGISIPDPTISAGVDRLASRQLLRDTGAAHSTDRPWLHFDLDRSNWPQISPDIARLHPEIWSGRADPETFTWFDLSPISPVALATVAYASSFTAKHNWQLTIVTQADAYAIAPIGLCFTNPDGSGRYDRTSGMETARIEFVFTPLRAETIERWELTYRGVVCAQGQVDKLAITPDIHLGCWGRIAALVARLPTIEVEVVGSSSIPEGTPAVELEANWVAPTYLRPIRALGG